MKYLIRTMIVNKNSGVIRIFEEDLHENDSIINALRRYGQRINKYFKNPHIHFIEISVSKVETESKNEQTTQVEQM